MLRQSPGHILNAYIYRNWDFIYVTRKFVNEIMYSLFKDKTFAEKVANGSSELIENAYKYSPEDSDFNIVIDDKDKEVVLEIRNFSKNDCQKAFQMIKKELEKVYSEPDPKEAFRKKILEFINNPKEDLSLGYAKIRLETEAIITADLEEEGVIVVKAHFPKSHK